MTVDFSWQPPDAQATPADPPMKSTEADRSASRYVDVIDQFLVDRSPRYKPGTGGGKTWCNLFICDCTAAMGCPLPRQNEKGEYQKLNQIHDWLLEKGPAHGWTEVSAKVATREAGLGKPVVVVWKNKDGDGHGAMIRPSPEGEYRVAQAGVRCFANGTLVAGFGSRPVRFFAHA